MAQTFVECRANNKLDTVINMDPSKEADLQINQIDLTLDTLDDNSTADEIDLRAILPSELPEAAPRRRRKRRRAWLLVLGMAVLCAGVGVLIFGVVALPRKTSSDSRGQGTDEEEESEPILGTSTPSQFPSDITSQVPSDSPSQHPTSSPVSDTSATLMPTFAPKMKDKDSTTTFYAIGDVPYDRKQAIELVDQMSNVPADAEFVIHVGDLRAKSTEFDCELQDYVDTADILRLSHAPVFVILGDNEWNDCPNHKQGLKYWKQEFEGFDSKYWNHDFDLERQDEYSENFAFLHKKTLFIALNLVGGRVHDEKEWSMRLTAEYEWTRELILRYKSSNEGIGRVVLFGHCNPKVRHNNFFVPLQQFVSDELKNELPLLYVNGDKHEWLHEENFLGQESFLRIMLTGGSSEPPVKFVVHADGMYSTKAFTYDRML